MDERVRGIEMGSRQTSGLFLCFSLLSLQPVYAAAVFTWVLELLKVERVPAVAPDPQLRVSERGRWFSSRTVVLITLQWARAPRGDLLTPGG